MSTEKHAVFEMETSQPYKNIEKRDKRIDKTRKSANFVKRQLTKSIFFTFLSSGS